MTRVEKMWQAIEEVKEKLFGKMRCYHMTADEMCALYDLVGKDAFRGISDTYYYGFIKGVRYQKAQEKKRRKAVRA